MSATLENLYGVRQSFLHRLPQTHKGWTSERSGVQALRRRIEKSCVVSGPEKTLRREIAEMYEKNRYPFSQPYQPGTPRAIRMLQIAQDPQYRWGDIPGALSMLGHLSRGPDPYLQDIAGLCAGQQIENYIASNDVFYPNYPPVGSLAIDGPCIWPGVMPTNDVLPLPHCDVPSNIPLIGQVNSGKSTLLLHLASQMVKAGMLVIIVDIKASARRLLADPSVRDRIIVIPVSQMKLSMFQPPPNVDTQTWMNVLVRVFGTAYQKYTSHRVLRQVNKPLMPARREGPYPTPKMMVKPLEQMRTRSWKDREYVSCILLPLIDLIENTKGIFEYTSSDFPERLYEQKGKLVILEEDTGQALEHLNYLVCWLVAWPLTYRRFNPARRDFVCVFALEDWSSLLDPKTEYVSPCQERT